MEHRFLPLLLVVSLVFLVPILLSRVRRVPVVVGEILAGIIVGPSILGWVHGDEPTLELLSEIGFAFLMFLSGLEIDFSLLFTPAPRGAAMKKRANPLWLAGGSFALTILLAVGFSFGMASLSLIRDPWMMMLILSTTSLGIVVPVLKERNLLSGRFGQTLLFSALLADFITMFLITVYVGIRSTGLSLEILLIGALFVPLLLFYRFGSKSLTSPSVRQLLMELSGATSQIKVRGAFAVMVAFVVLAEMVGAELILGAFLGGVLISLLIGAGDEALRHKLDAIGYGFFIPLFFVYVGIRFDLSAFIHDPSAWILLPVLLFASFAIKLISALLFRFAFSWRKTLASGFLLSARLSLIIAASAIGLRLGVISESTNAAVILVAALTATFAPFFFNSLLPEDSSAPRHLMILYGKSDLATQVARELQAHGDKICHVTSLDGADSLSECIETLPPARIHAFLALSDEDKENLDACRIAHAHGVRHLLALVYDPRALPRFRDFGVQTFVPSLYRSALISLMARNPAMFDLLTSTTDDRDLREVDLTNRFLDGKRLREITFAGDVLALTIQRGDERIVPHGTTRLALGDRLTLLGSLEALSEAESLLSGG
jgi:Kef-type K+ transport system membrane component KefB/Trk K+ transport system NAD-binding subunit